MNVPDRQILFTVDLEDWFQVENLKAGISHDSWSSRELRVEKSTHRILDLLESVKQGSGHDPPQATFFFLGWIAQRLPHLVREIHARGHEVASHGYSHQCCHDCSAVELERDLLDSKKLLENIVGDRVYGYRAPSFSIRDDVLKIIESCGYSYDSSYNSFSVNRRYGQIQFAGSPTEGISVKISDSFRELPISNLHWRNIVLPWGGGGYFRLIPLIVFRLGVKSILRRNGAYLFYVHPWEIDPDQPRVDAIPMFYRFRHYANLSRTHHKIESLFNQMRDCCFVSCRTYLDLIRRTEDGIG